MDSNSEINANQSIILFDGVCNLCNFFVNFIIDRDPYKEFKFASLQSHLASELLKNTALNEKYLESIVLIKNGNVFLKSRAALEVLRKLGYPWKLAYAFVIIPPVISDFVYDIIAKNRYSWFGRRDVCRIPTPDILERFLDS